MRDDWNDLEAAGITHDTPVRLHRRLVIAQSPAAHRQIAELLRTLRGKLGARAGEISPKLHASS